MRQGLTVIVMQKGMVGFVKHEKNEQVYFSQPMGEAKDFIFKEILLDMRE